MSESTTDPIEGWAIVELMGHRKLGGYVRPHALGGVVLLRVDVHDEVDGVVATQFYSPSAIYCITPTTEITAKALARNCRPEPATRWDIAPQRPALNVAPEPEEESDVPY